MLRTKLFKGFVIVVILFAILSAFVGIRIINERIIDEAQTRVSLDLSSAWAIYNSKLREVEVIMRLAASKEAVVAMCETRNWNDSDVQSRLDRIRHGFGLDFLDVLGPNGQVVMRTTAPTVVGDYRTSDPAVVSALKGDAMACMATLSQAELQKESESLADRALLPLEDTPHARPRAKDAETRGMVMVAAVPVRQGMQIVGVVYGGILISKNNDLVDTIRNTVFKNEQYKGVPVGTATIFLNDCRIATTVLKENGNRALGTRASKEVAETVLDNGKPWMGEAFVVKDRCLAAYDPIRDGNGQVIGMLYVGILKAPFEAIGHGIMIRYIFVSLFVLFFSLVLAFIIASRMAQPIHRLVMAANHMCNGKRPAPVSSGEGCHETNMLIRAFNEMAATLAEREEKLKALNRSYMETLGFVSHELKSPVATIMNYGYLLKEQKLGATTEKQQRALRAIDAASQRLVEMVRHYLNLSRIENGELLPVRSHFAVLPDVLTPVLEGMEADLESRTMKVRNNIAADVVLHADVNMVREVFENLIGNAIKYGRDGGALEISARPLDGFVEFVVRNEGDGIPPDKIGNLFQKFSRIESTDRDRAKRGTGLGLFITKNIVEAHGGRICAESRIGEWTEFIFTLPRFTGEKV
jgi:two-component system NtrC family sensor kinase